ncbi:DUF6086 family protein [Actinoplanes missouriensis]|uniref:DUF6086 family protein n=1 Tax=Actinoplanes missouriensis TaxID=1866 RepID=UPI00340C5050
MSYVFDLDGEEVWAPSNRVAQLYLGMIETAARVLRLPTGLRPKPSGDWYDIDRAEFTALVTGMVREFAASGHWEFRIMVGSLLGVSIGICDRAGITIETRDEKERTAVADLRDAAF